MTTVEWHDRFDPLEAEWDELADEVAAGPFIRPGWLRAWWAAFGQGTSTVLCVRRNGALVALLPLQRGRGSLRSQTNWHNASSGLVAVDDEAARALADALFATGARSISVSCLDTALPGRLSLVESAGAASYRTLERVVERPPFASLAGTWESYLAAVSKNARADVGRRLRRLEEAGDLQLDVNDGTERIDDLLREGFAVEAAGWKGAQGTAISSRPETLAYYTDAARWAASRGFLQLAFLRLDGAAIGFHLNVVADGVHSHVKGGYDEAFQHFSPGKVLHRLLLERAFAAGLRRYDFLGSDEPYKLQWANDARELVRIQAFRNSPAGLVERAGYVYARPVAKRAIEKARALRGRHA